MVRTELYSHHRFWYILIGLASSIHILLATKYTALPDNSEMFSWLGLTQYFTPTFLLGLLRLKAQRLTNPIVDVPLWTNLGLIMVIGTFGIYFYLTYLRWFAWTTLGMLILSMIFVANMQTELPNTSRWLLGGMSSLFAIGTFECLYQIGLWFYHDFFGSTLTNFRVTLIMQLLWIVPPLITVLVLYLRGLRLRVTNLTVACFIITTITSVIWFATGMDIPLLFWQGRFIAINESANPILISISRACQTFLILGITNLAATSRVTKELSCKTSR